MVGNKVYRKSTLIFTEILSPLKMWILNLIYHSQVEEMVVFS